MDAQSRRDERLTKYMDNEMLQWYLFKIIYEKSTKFLVDNSKNMLYKGKIHFQLKQ